MQETKIPLGILRGKGFYLFKNERLGKILEHESHTYHEDRDFNSLSSFFQHLKYCLVYRKHSPNICSMNEQYLYEIQYYLLSVEKPV